MQKFFPSRPNQAITFLHRLDPRTKLALLLASFIMALLPQRPEQVALAASAVLLHLSLARAWPWLVRLRWLLLILALFSITVWSLLAKGPHLLFWRVSRESLAFGVATFLKLATMLTAGLVLLATTSNEELFLGLVKLRLPYPVAFAFALALRWAPEILATALRVKEAQQVRGLVWETGSVLTRLKRHLPLLVPIFLLTLRRSQTMAWALEARGFQMHHQRSYLLNIQLASQDWVALALATLLVGVFFACHLLGWDRITGLAI